jgi:hypothetical protein
MYDVRLRVGCRRRDDQAAGVEHRELVRLERVVDRTVDGVAELGRADRAFGAH